MNEARLQELMEEGVAAGLYPAGVFSVFAADGRQLAGGAAGTLGPDGAVLPDADTVWDLASLTKPLVTATCLLHLAERGLLHLGEPVASYLPGPSPALEGITLRHCLTHTAGLRAWENLYAAGESRDEVLARLRRSERQRPPGTGYTYSDLGYILLGEAVSAAAGAPLEELSAARVFAPLGMTSTGYRPPAAWQPRLAPTRALETGEIRVGTVHDDNCRALGGAAGHAGLFGSLRDLQRYGAWLLRPDAAQRAPGACGEAGGVLSPLAAAQMAANQNPPGIDGHTLGWFTRPNGFLPAGDFLPADTFGHTGFTGTSLLLCPSLGAGILLLTNRVYQQRDAGEFLRFRRRFHNAAAALLGHAPRTGNPTDRWQPEAVTPAPAAGPSGADRPPDP